MSVVLHRLPADEHDDEPREGRIFSHYVLFPALIKFYGDFSSTRMTFMPGVEDTVDHARRRRKRSPEELRRHWRMSF